MTITKNTGLFYVERLKTSNDVCHGVFCQPVDISIYSAPYPAKHRVVSYRILFWDDCKQPDIEKDYDKGSIFGVGPLDEKVFTFTTGTMPTSIAHLTTIIRRHFLEVVSKGGSFLDKRDALRRLRGATGCSDRVSLADGRIVEVNNVRHVERVRHNESFIYQNVESVIIYNTALINDTREVGDKDLPTKRSFEKAYSNTRSLLRDAVSDFVTYIEHA